MSTPVSQNRFAAIAPAEGEMDLDDDPQGVSASMHAPPSFADVVAGSRATALPLRATPPERPEQSSQFAVVSPASVNAGPSVGDKRPFEQVDSLTREGAPSKRTTSAAVVPTVAAVAPVATLALVPTHAPIVTTAQAVSHAGLPTLVGLPAAAASSQEVDTTPAAAPLAHEEMNVDATPPAAQVQIPAVPPPYVPPAAAHVLSPPDAGFPLVYGLEQGLLAFVHNHTIALWNQQEGASALVYIASDGMAANMTSRIKAVDAFFRAVFPDFPAPEVGPPEFFTRSDRKVAFRPVIPFFVSGRDDLITALKSRSCWPTPLITLFVTSMTPEVTDFAIAIAGFPLERTNASDLIVAGAARNAINNDVYIRAFITNNNDNLPDVQPDQLINTVVNSIRVQSTSLVEDNVSITVFNLYITPPTKVSDRLKTWIQELKRLKYSCFRGAGFWRPAFYCDLCKGRDHPTATCPFAAITGWPASPAFVNDAPVNGAPANSLGGARGGHSGYRGRGGSSLRGRRGRGTF